MDVSVCMVVKNEELLLKRCLESLGEFKEIIVIDTGSTDKTVEIAKGFTDEVYGFEGRKEYAGAGFKARNHSLKFATKDWILIIDGDEILDSTKEIKEIIKKPNAEAYSIIQRNYTNSANSAGFKAKKKFSFPGYYDNRIIRLFRNKPRIKFSSEVHEKVDKSIKGKVLDSDIIVHHLRELKNMEKEKQLNYLKLGDDHLGKAIVYQNQKKDYEKAIYHYKQALKEDPKKKEALINLTYLLLDRPEVAEILRKALSYYPDDVSLLNNYTAYLIKSKEYDKAKKIVDKILKKDPDNINALMNKAYLAVVDKEYLKALAYYDRILALAPNFKEAKLNRKKLLELEKFPEFDLSKGKIDS